MVDERLQRDLLKYLDEQIRFFELAWQDMRTDTPPVPARPDENDRFWYGVQSAILAVGNVSKILWGSKGSFAEERADMRELLGIGDDSPLRDTAMRNLWEHLDEKIDKAHREGEGFHTDRIVAGVPPYVTDKSLFRWFERHTLTISFWGETWRFTDMVPELAKIRDAIDQYPLDRFWFPKE